MPDAALTIVDRPKVSHKIVAAPVFGVAAYMLVRTLVQPRSQTGSPWVFA